MSEIERLPAEAYMPEDGLVYEDVFKLHSDYFEDLAFEANIVLVGPKGIGKTLSVASYAARITCPIVTFDCSEDVRRSHLLGMFVLRGDHTPFVLGPLTTAIEIANEQGMCILCLEEINALTPQLQKSLNSISDFRRKIEVPEAKRVFKLDPESRLWVVGTMNTSVYGGVYALNEDLKSRFDLYPLEYPKLGDEKTILKSVLADMSLQVDTKVMDSVLRFAHETRQGELDYALSTRDLVAFLRNIAKVGIQRSCWIITGKFEDDDRDTVKEWIQSTFGVKV